MVLGTHRELIAYSTGPTGDAASRAFRATGGVTGRAYGDFAIENPALSHLIFSSPASVDLLTPPSGDLPDVMAFLRTNAEAVAGDHDDAEVIVLKVWSLANDLAMLVLDGQAVSDEETIRRIFANL